MKTSNLQQVPYFDNRSFFKDSCPVYIQLSTEFPKYVGVMHRHQFVEIVYILSGEATHTVGDREYTVKSGDVVVINCGVPHKFTASTTGELFVAYDLMFGLPFIDPNAGSDAAFESLKDSYLFGPLFPADETPDIHISGKRYGSYGDLFTRIYHALKGKERGYLELSRAYVIELIVKILKDMGRDGSKELTSENKKAVFAAISYMERRYNNPLTVEDIAAQVFLSPEYFRKLFKKMTGESVRTYLHGLRVDEACRLLTVTDMSIQDISIAVGYQDMKSFYQAFKQKTGKTPKEYRNHQ